MGPFMTLQKAFFYKCFVTIAASESFDMSLHGCTTECEILTEIKDFNFTTILFSFHHEQQPNIENCCSNLKASKQLKGHKWPFSPLLLVRNIYYTYVI